MDIYPFNTPKMSDRDDCPIEVEPSVSRFHIPQANRDLQSNWELDLAKNLDEYILKICSGEVSPDQESSINFAEAALLLQGSVHVYSRKVEYLYSLVLAALEFLSQKRQDQQEKTSVQPDGSESIAVVDHDNEVFLGLDDVPVEPKNWLDHGLNKEETSNHFLKVPANLLVPEGDYLDNSGDGGELESYLLNTCNFYKDFLLLDPCDAAAVYNFLKSNALGQEQPTLHKGCSPRSKRCHSNFASSTGRSGVAPHKSSLGGDQGVTLDGNSESNHAYGINNDSQWPKPPFNHDCPGDDMHPEEELTLGVLNDGDVSDSDSDDPWKPLNPHEPGNLKIKPLKASKPFGRQVIRNPKQKTVTSQFPVAKVDGIISPELAESFEVQLHLQEKQNASQTPPFFEKLRRSFANGEENFDAFGGVENENDDNGVDDFPDFEHAEFDIQNNTYDMDTELSSNQVKDALLASIAESKKQTELATRVSTWKQRIEQTLEEQDTHPPFDMHQYGEIILDKLYLDADGGGRMPFTDVVKGQLKHDVARTFSALLQLVNNGDVDLQRALCYTAENPFTVKLLRSNRRKEEMGICSTSKGVKSPSRNRCSNKANPSTSETISPSGPSHQNDRLSVKLGKGPVILCTP